MTDRLSGKFLVLRTLAVLSTSSLALAVAAQPAMAQQADASASTAAPGSDSNAKSDEKIQEIVVTGLRRSLTTARDTKRAAEVVLDSISAEDIGALPDKSVVESLQRVPGVALMRTNDNRDPARLSAEGGGVTIRGLTWVRSELNGRDMFGAANGRSIGFEDVSPDLVSGIDVIKNYSANLIEGGVGGTVVLKTRKPLDEKGPVIAFSGDWNQTDLYGKGFLSGSALFSDKWQVGSVDVGLLLSAGATNVGNRTDSIQNGTFAQVTPTTTVGNMQAGQTYNIPTSLGWRRIDFDQVRQDYDAVLQFRTANNMTLTLEGFVAISDPHDLEHAEGVYSLPTQDASYKFDSNNNLVSGVYNNANMDLDTRIGQTHNVTRDFSANWTWKADDHWKLSADIQRVSADMQMLSFTGFSEFGAGSTAYNSTTRPNISFNFAGDTPNVSVATNGANLNDPTQYWWAAAMDHIENNNAGSWAEKADVEYKFDEGHFLNDMQIGIRANSEEAISRQTGYNWSLLSREFWGGGTPVYLSAAGANAAQFNYSNFFRGSVNMPGVGWFPSASLMNMGTAGAYNFLKSTETAGWGWSPLTAASYTNAVPAADNPLGGVADQHQKTFAGYAMLRFGDSPGLFKSIDGNIGVRVVHTSVDAAGTSVIGAPPSMTPAACLAAHSASDCAFLVNAYTFSGGGGKSPIDFTNSYTDVLPSLNLRYYVNRDMLLRFAASKAIVRPSFTQMVPFDTLGFNAAPNGYSASYSSSAPAFTGTAGNPALKPTQAWQFDLSYEYYWGHSNQFTAGLFYKDIKDYIFSGVVNQTYTNNGVTDTFEVTKPLNGSHGTIKGLELDYQQFFDFLPGLLSGLGFDGNFTFVDSTGGRNTSINVFDIHQNTGGADQTLPLEGLSKYTFNLEGLYQKHGVELRVAYNWRSHYLMTTSAANLNAPVWSENYGQLDGSLAWQVNKWVKIGVQGQNLLNSRTFLDVGGATDHPRYSWSDTDRRFDFFVRSRF